MEKLDKEALAKELHSIFNNEGNAYYIQVGIVKGLEYAENHYLPMIENRNKLIDKLLQDKLNLEEELLKTKTESVNIIEEKDKEIKELKIHYQVGVKCSQLLNEQTKELQQVKQEHAKSCDDFGSFRESLQSELQQAKELLKELSSALNKTLWQWENPMEQGYKLGNKIEEFLKQ